jgi:hypothetical protein
MRLLKPLAVIALSLIVLASPVAAAQPSVSIQNIPPTPHGAPAGTSLQSVASFIKRAMGDVNWVVVGEAPGMISAKLLIRSHRAAVTIGFNETDYWINYKDSDNLNYTTSDRKKLNMGGSRRQTVMKGPRIHPNYNKWVEGLSRRIQLRAKRAHVNQEKELEPASSPLQIADELRKLEALRQQSVLTQEEFDAQKAKLLGR